MLAAICDRRDIAVGGEVASRRECIQSSAGAASRSPSSGGCPVTRGPLPQQEQLTSMRSASISSIAARTWKVNRPAGVVVSMPCLSTTRLIPRSSKQRGDLGEVAHRAGHPGKPSDHELVAAPEMIEAVVPLGSPGELARGGVSPVPLTARGTQRVELGVVPLRASGDPGVPVPGHSGSVPQTILVRFQRHVVSARCYAPLMRGGELGRCSAVPITPNQAAEASRILGGVP